MNKVMTHNGRMIAKTHDYEGNIVTLREVQARGINPFTDDYGYITIYVVIEENAFDEVQEFFYTDKETAFRMFRKFLVK